MWVGGILLAIMNILLFVIKYPWGASGGYVNIGQNLFQMLGISSMGTHTPINLPAKFQSGKLMKNIIKDYSLINIFDLFFVT